MMESRIGYVAILLPSGQVLVAGGSPGPLPSAEIYDPASDQWTSAGTMQTGRVNAAIAALKTGSVLVTGGGFMVPSADIYEPAAPPDAGASSDASDATADAPAPPNDATSSLDAPTGAPDTGVDASSVAGPAGDDSGCGCRAGAASPPGATAAVSIMFSIVAFSSRRRRNVTKTARATSRETRCSRTPRA
jgi:hypothetical protein